MDFPSSAYPATLSYALCRLFALAGGAISPDFVTSSWHQLREITGQPRTPIPPEAIAFVWSTVLGAWSEFDSASGRFGSPGTLRAGWAGVQSTTVLLMALHGEFPDHLDCAIFADTGWEPKAVYKHLEWLEGRSREGGIPIYRVSAGNLRQDLLAAVAGKKPHVANPPFYVRNRDQAGKYATPDKGGMLWRKRP